MKFCGDYYDIMKIIIFSLAMHHGKFYIERFSIEFRSIMEVSKLPWLHKKRISRMKRIFFIDNVQNIFVLSILQTMSGTSTPI